MRTFMGVDMRRFLKSSKFLLFTQAFDILQVTTDSNYSPLFQWKKKQYKAMYNDIPEWIPMT